MEHYFKERVEENNKLVEEMCMQKLDDLYQNLRRNNTNGKYNVPGGYKMYKEEYNDIIKAFDRDMNDVDQDKVFKFDISFAYFKYNNKDIRPSGNRVWMVTRRCIITARNTVQLG